VLNIIIIVVNLFLLFKLQLINFNFAKILY